MTWHLAQLNIARLHAPPGDPRVQEFIDALVPVNALAEASPGFIWRLQSDEGDATAIRIDDDERLVVNLSVWASVQALSDFVHRTDHVSYLRRRKEWFEPFGAMYQAMWWVPAGHRPDVAEAMERLELLRVDGPTPQAFTFARPFDAPVDTAFVSPNSEGEGQWNA